MYELTQKEKEYLLAKRKVSYFVIQDGYWDKKDSNYYAHCHYLHPTQAYARCWCKRNAGKKIEQGDICLNCGKTISLSTKVVNKNVIEQMTDDAKKVKYKRISYLGKESYIDGKSNLNLDHFFYVRKHPEKENSIQILKLALSVKAGKTVKDEEELIWKTDYIIEVVPNEGSRAYKISKGQEVEIDLFDAFQINSQTMKGTYQIEYEDSIGPIDFMLKHKKTNQYTGFMDCFNLVDISLSRDSFFMLYMYLYAQYPVVEFVVKMKYLKLVAQIMKNLSNGYNKEYIKGQAQQLTKILNPEATNGSIALNVPRYIADDLNERSANIDEYIMWGDINQLSNNKIMSKENYMTVVKEPTYYYLLQYKSNIPNILKYGYTMKELLKYIQKQMPIASQNHDRFTYVIRIFGLWKDYLEMCDLLGVEHEKFPMNIESAHNNVQVAFQAKRDELANTSIGEIAKLAEKYIPNNKQYNDSQYVIKLPHSVTDIVQEGQRMHNCVGSYVNKISNKQSLVFFIRKKENPDQSFITAEYRHGKLTQIYYKNNQHVFDKEILEIAEEYCKLLRKPFAFVA